MGDCFARDKEKTPTPVFWVEVRYIFEVKKGWKKAGIVKIIGTFFFLRRQVKK